MMGVEFKLVKKQHFCPFCNEEASEVSGLCYSACEVTVFHCPECQALLPCDNKVCPDCGARIQG